MEGIYMLYAVYENHNNLFLLRCVNCKNSLEIYKKVNEFTKFIILTFDLKLFAEFLKGPKSLFWEVMNIPRFYSI